jgi:PAS domain S-box-containing protein
MNDSTTRPLDFDPYRLLFPELTDYAISVLDVNGFIVAWNSGAQQLKGYTPEEITGQHFSIFYRPEDIEHDQPPRALAHAAGLGRVEEEGWRLRKDGSRFWANVVIIALRDESGRLRGFGEVTRQLREALEKEPTVIEYDRLRTPGQLESQVEERTKRLAQTIKHLENANRMKDNVLATVSHELLTPLTAMTGWIKMLRSGELSEPQIERAHEVIDRNLSSQKELINDLLNVSRMVSGKLTVTPQPLDPAPIIQQIIDSVRPSVDAKQLQLEIDLDLDVGAVPLDPVRFQQIISNLLTNAVKFTQVGGLIRVRLKRGERHAILSVSDTGQGIASEFLPYVFDRYRQADSSWSGRHGGLGLGLSIVRHLVELHGGSVSVKSRGPGHGTTFSVLFPMSSISANQLTKRQTAGDFRPHNRRSSEMFLLR